MGVGSSDCGTPQADATIPIMADALPDWLVIGAMKAGTTTVHEWLTAQPECFAPPTKETNFFAKEDVWANGVDWYRNLFAAAPPDALKGESSPLYTLPSKTENAARRIHDLIPAVRLIYLVREPLERIRSQFEHNVSNGRERRSLATALSVPDNAYVGRSLYHACLSPYIERFPADQICVVSLGGTPGAEADCWHRVLRHVGLSTRPVPDAAFNVTAAKANHVSLVRWLARSGRWNQVERLPRPVRRAGRRLLVRPPKQVVTRDDVEAAMPTVTHDRLRADTERLCAWLGTSTPPWESAEELSQP
jgi:hypothetical protein